jgi:succinate-semialdehyde dehydrogenase
MREETVSINPATGEIVGRYPAHDGAAIEATIAGAQAGYRVWRDLTAQARGARIAALGGVLTARRADLAHLITTEMGKPITQALGEVDKCALLCRWYGDNLERLLADEVADVGADGQAIIACEPLGVVLGVMPWNFPLWQVLRAAIPIMGTGNGFVLKHADNVQGAALALADCFAAAGFPEHVFGQLNIDRAAVVGLLADPRIVGVSVTAGVAAGAAMAGEAGRHLKPSVLELGGSDPFIVLADADLERAAQVAVQARFQNCGQVCIAAKRIIVAKEVADAFLELFVAKTKALPCGDPLDPATYVGPMARTRLRSEVHELVEASIAQGAQLVLGGAIPEGVGAFYPPTILTHVRNDMPICRQEAFGPVAPILIADTDAHAIALANDSIYGLSASVWSADLARAQGVARALETGGVFINAMSASDPRVPIGGIKHSGYGRELSHFGLKEFSNLKLIWTRE